jgi:hypothetical protein
MSALVLAAPARGGLLDLPPVNLIPPVITGVPAVGNPLACSPGVWVGPPSSYAYQWSRAGVSIPGATGSSYTVTSSDVAQAIRCTVTGSNSMGSSAATSLPVTGLPLGSPGSGGGTGGTPSPAPSPGTQPSVPNAADVVILPKRRCVSRRHFRIRIRKVPNVTLAAVAVYVNGKPAKVVKGSRLYAPVDLRGMPRGRFAVRIEAVTTDGRMLRHTRKYRTCEKPRKATRKHRL